ncbi:MAG TPA: hypothetical protein VKB59_19460 [Micromonosporaceae bacterium]|nr:hypothetical protein [Micromonosporaceae bacterium]
MRLEDLPPKLRQAAINAIARDELARATRPPAVPRSQPARSGRGGRWTCHRCDETFSAYAPAERHVDTEHGAGRIAWAEGD